jgi:TPR repeat protein
MTALRQGGWFARAIMFALGAILWGSLAMAAPDDDYREGERAYRQGDVSRAITMLRKAADAGLAKAQSLLAEILDQAEFNDEALAYYRKAAEQGDVDGEVGLAGMYASGDGVKRDPQQALHWFTRAAEHGHVQAIKVVAGAYIFGELGLDATAQAGPAAGDWIRRAAALDFIPAVEALAGAYRKGGFGIEADVKQAELWEAKLDKLRPGKGARKNATK